MARIDEFLGFECFVSTLGKTNREVVLYISASDKFVGFSFVNPCGFLIIQLSILDLIL